MRGFENWTEADIARIQASRSSGQQTEVLPAKKPSKYKNRTCYVGSERFDSKHEAECWLTLQLLERDGVIHDLQRQVPFELCCPIEGTQLTTVVCIYRADFTWKDREEVFHVGDAKSEGTRTALYLLKAKHLNLQKGIRIEEL